MKKFSFYLAVFFSVFLISVTPAKAQLLFGVSFDFMGDAVAAITPVFEKAQTAKDQFIAKVKEKVTKFKAKLKSYFVKRKKVVDKIPGTKDFAENSSVDIYNPEAVEKAMEELFLQYPSEDKRINAFYEKEAQEFYYDTLVETYTATQQLSQRLDDLRKDVDKFAEDIMSTSASGEVASTDDENGNYYNMYLANKKFNDTLKITQEVLAMHSQFYVAQQIYRKKILPQPFVDETEKDVLGKNTDKAADKTADKKDSSKRSSYKSTEKLAFAQFIASGEDLDEKEATSEKKEVAKKVSALEFSVPKTPDLSPALYSSITKIEQMAEISEVQTDLRKAIKAHNTLQMMPTYKQLYVQYDMFVKMHEKARQAVEVSDKCVLQYLVKRYNKPERIWYGADSLTSSSTDYDARKGISGWAISSYTLAQAQKSSIVDVDSFSSIDFGVETGGNTLAPNPSLEAKLMSTPPSLALISPSKEQEFADSVREIELLTWQIGSQAAKILAADQYSSEKVFGNPHTPYPIWRDQKSFYKQYIDGKYENMKAYVKRMNLNSIAVKAASIINEEKYQKVVSSDEKKEKAQNDADLNRLAMAAKAKEDELDKRAESILASKKEALNALAADEGKKLSKPEANKAVLEEDLDNISTSISLANEQIAEADTLAAEGEAWVEASHRLIVEMNKRGTELESVAYTNAQSNFSRGKKQQLSQMQKATDLRLGAKKLEIQRGEILAEIASVNASIEKIKEEYINKKSLMDIEYDAKIEALTQLDNNLSLVSLASSLKLNNSALRPILALSDNLITKGKDEAVKLIEKAQNDISSWGDSVYEAQNHDRLLKRHVNLVNSLKNMSFGYSLSSVLFLDMTKPVELTKLLSTMLQSKVVGDICSKYTCTEPDTDYFVGAPAKARDFAAPKTPLSEHYPPVRDIFHFDVTDYKATNKAAGGVVLKSSFLNYGGEIPAIWKRVLSGKAFVEKDIKLSSFLEQGGENEAFMRGVKFPCRHGKYVIDVASSGQYVINFDPRKDMLECSNLVVNSRFPLGNMDLKKGLYTVTDLEAEDSAVAAVGGTTTFRQPSELGTVLRYIGGFNPKLRMNNSAYAVFETLVRQEEEAKNNVEVKYGVLDNIYQQAAYNTNQIGNFLHFVDKELSIRKSVDELSMSIEETTASIREIFSEMGFVLSEDIDLANNKDYEMIVLKLKDYKNEHISAAVSKMSSIDTSDDVLRERYDTVNNTKLALIQDAKALITLDEKRKAGETLSADIITEEANQKVIEKAQQAGYDALMKEVDQLEEPLCVAY